MASQSHESSAADHAAAAEWTQRKRGRTRTMEELGTGGEKRNEASPLVERRLRERKSVDRYQGRISTSKVLAIQQGPGEKLQDIPNVAFKMSEREVDESVRVLHTILFGGQANVHSLKRNILQFSGFVCSENENKVRLSVKEKLDSCKKDRLLQFCDLLDIYTVKVTTKKEEILDKLLEFLEFPHVTREVVISENEKRLNRFGESEAKRGLHKSLRVEEEDQDDSCTTVKKEEPVEEGMDKAVYVEPSTEQLRAVVIEILKEVDFDVTTLADVIRQLGTHFNTDLMHRKKEIKSLLENVISEMTDEEEDEENNDNENIRTEEDDESKV